VILGFNILHCLSLRLSVSDEHGGVGNVPLESDGRPRGSFNRWNYNQLYHPPATPQPAAYRERARGGDNAGIPPREQPQPFTESSHYHRWRQAQRMRTFSTSPPPTPGRHVELDAKVDVDWAYDSMTFYLRVSLNSPSNFFQFSHASWEVLDFVLKTLGPGKSWQNILEIHTFLHRLKWKNKQP